MKFKAKIESINLESDVEYTKINFNHIKFNEPILDNLFLLLNAGEMVEIEIKRVTQ